MSEGGGNKTPQTWEPERERNVIDAPVSRRSWYVSMHGEIYGPADVDTLARWAAEGRFGCHCWVREADSMRWVGAESVPELRRILASWPLPLATFRQRLLAQLVDCAILAAPLLVALIVMWQTPAGPGTFSFFAAAMLGSPISLFVVASNELILVASRGQSIGKIVVGIAVVDRRGARPGWATAATRAVTKYAPFAVMGYFGAIWLPIDGLSMRSHPYRQTYHDRWSNTYVCQLRGGPLGLRAGG
jgi:uncharacterized RDD family membrane protein YckC